MAPSIKSRKTRALLCILCAAMHYANSQSSRYRFEILESTLQTFMHIIFIYIHRIFRILSLFVGYKLEWKYWHRQNF